MKYWFYIVQDTHTVVLFKNTFFYCTHSVKNEILSILGNGYFLKIEKLIPCSPLFVHFLVCPSLYDYGVKMPNFSFYGRCRYATTNLFSVRSWIWFLGSELQERSLTFEIIAVMITCWRKGIHFLSDAFTASPPWYLNNYLLSQRVYGFLLPARVWSFGGFVLTLQQILFLQEQMFYCFNFEFVSDFKVGETNLSSLINNNLYESKILKVRTDFNQVYILVVYVLVIKSYYYLDRCHEKSGWII